MKGDVKRILSTVGCVFALMSLCLAVTESYADPTVCESGVGEPPFLSYGVDPNVLLMIDNSGSMLDPAYIQTTLLAGAATPPQCYDESYDLTGATTYAGYFEDDSWYSYDTGTMKFVKGAAPGSCQFDGQDSAGNKYVCVTTLAATASTPKTVSAFAAKGRFLNWAAISKFDIQKELLTGGKYDSTNKMLLPESRGCLGRRFVKQVTLAQPFVNDPYKLALGVRGPMEVYDAWRKSTAYVSGNIVQYLGTLYKAPAAGVAASATFIAANWEVYKDTRWYSGKVYPAGASVYDVASDSWYWTEKEGSSATSPSDPNFSSNDIWEPFHGTEIEVYDIKEGGFNATACQAAIEDLQPGSTKLGSLAQDTKACMGFDTVSGGFKTVEGASQSVYNQSLQSCWYFAAHDGTWQSGNGIVATMNGCEKLYTSINPADISSWDSGYACYGIFPGSNPAESGYLGRCWNGNGWIEDKNVCTEKALEDYCKGLSVPEVIDPSDSVNSTGATWNTPAMLVDSGVMGQLDKPLLIMKGRVAVSIPPDGIIQTYADEIRIGAMQFNKNGARTECSNPAGPIRYDCPSDNRDGAVVIGEIAKNDPNEKDTTKPSYDHTKRLVKAINGIEANSWTPLGEAMFTAIGYYTQNDQFKCQTTTPEDFTIYPPPVSPAPPEPVQYWCQNNHIVLITDGSSTADGNAVMTNAIANTPIPDINGNDVVGGCTDGLYGSTYLDNFTYFGAHAPAAILYGPKSQIADTENVLHNKKNIKTHIVVAGTLRDTKVNNECNPKVIVPEAANDAKLDPTDTLPLYESKNYDELKNNLNQVFSGIRSGASAGSAASVISSSRGGEGAVYQAIFWPSKPSSTDATIAVKWAGEVHSLFIDTNGYMYEDSDGDMKMDITKDKRVIIYFDNTSLTSRGCYLTLNPDGTCSKPVDMDDVRYLWSATNWLAKISAFGDSTDNQYLNRSGTDYISNKRRRYIFTWNDLNNDGIVVPNETLPFVSKTAAGPATTNWSAMISAPDLVSINRRPVTNDFNVDGANLTTAADKTAANAEVNKIVEWIRGVEVPGFRSRTVTKKMAGVTPDPQIVWRLGDVVHSTPTAVARPMEGLHLLYGDVSYAKFVTRWSNRRNMAYFGANDGMLHAVNAGFYNETGKKYCLSEKCDAELEKPELGAEMWAYVPYNLLPHLKCLTSPDYAHKFYVDQRPRVFDARIFTAEPECATNANDPACKHPDGWGTVLIGAMRFGGARVKADTLSGDMSDTDNRNFTSAYFLLDITNPEAPPVLLGEFTMPDNDNSVDLGFTTPMPTPVVMTSDQEPFKTNNPAGNRQR